MISLHFFNSYSPPAPWQKFSSPGHFILSRPQCLQNTHKGLHRASKQPQKRVKGENRLRCSVQRREVKRGTNSVSMILYFHIFPQAQLKKEFITQLTAVRDKPLACVYVCTRTHTCTHKEYFLTALCQRCDMWLEWGLSKVKSLCLKYHKFYIFF